MIPDPAPLAPLLIILTLAAAAFVWGAAASGSAAARGRLTGRWVLWSRPSGRVAEDGVPVLQEVALPWRSLGFAMAGTAGLLAMACALLAVGAMVNYPKMYERSVWSALDTGYGIHAAIPEQGFEPGVPFSAERRGQTVECSVTPPSTVICGNEVLQPGK